ncbi:replication protein A 70 kDa DNA-binding subunit B-like [Raphanus sativus]|uniref:Replication protein A 70 kDa DNA-binding subunit B-like n=1 Tax=Raphanus sativus TaxID=3726 RepID=A0A6J0LYA7_RAPSA|nr:replication protein A 70 kDa DNA-binding subunit B-like [Raphanus sativus]
MAMVQATKNRVSFIRQLRPCKDTWRIEVRIIRLWRNYNKDSGNTIKMVLADKEGTRIHAQVAEQLIKQFEGKLTEGDAKVIQLFKLYDAIGDYRTTAHPYKIGFFQTTFVGPADDFPSEVPKKYLVDYTDIIDGKLDNSRLVDVIGQIVNFGSLENKVIKGKDNLRLLIELRDQNDVKLMCTLWGSYAKQVYDYSMLNMSNMVIAIMRFCSIKEWKGAYSISTGYNSTYILLNPTLDLIENFKASLPNDSLALTNNDSSQWSVGSATSVRARFFVTNERLTIREIIDSELVGTFVTLVTIDSIDADRGWQYLSCKYHNKKVMPTTNVDADNRPLFLCIACDKEHTEVISRFKLIANVKDASGEAKFLLFDINAQLIVRHPAAELYDEDEDPDILPIAVSDLCGKRFLFEISVDADNIKGKTSQYVVRLATEDREMIEEFADLPPKSVLMLQNSDDISSASGDLSVTPLSKRKSEEEHAISPMEQHSVTKKQSRKKIKGE